MAITHADCVLWRLLRDADAIPDRPSVLEIGKANWYGDVPADQFYADLAKYGSAESRRGTSPVDVWAAAERYYKAMLREPSVVTAIDLDPAAPGARREDLNCPIRFPYPGFYDVIINTGTAEHVFDLRQVWETMHDAAKPGGLMVHSMPLWGWLDHGFVNYQPTFIADLAAANNYEVLVWLYAELRPAYVQRVHSPADIHQLAYRGKAPGQSGSAMMHVAFRKPVAGDAAAGQSFRVPMQGVYAARATEDEKRAWLARR